MNALMSISSMIRGWIERALSLSNLNVVNFRRHQLWMLSFRLSFNNAVDFKHLDSVSCNYFKRLCLWHAIRTEQKLSINDFDSFSKHHLKMTRVTNERRLQEKFRKHKTNVFKKANELTWMTESKIHIIIQHNDKDHTYKSTEKINWPLFKELVSHIEFILKHHWTW